MKRILAICLCMVLAFSFVACGTKTQSTPTEEKAELQKVRLGEVLFFMHHSMLQSP